MSTFMAKKEEVKRDWYVIDAAGKPLGRLATQVAMILKGKHKPIYTPHVDTGDYVIIVNADKVILTGKKMDNKMYYSHTGYPGGIKSQNFRSLMSKSPEKVVYKAVWGMLPHNALGRKMIKKLKIYAGAEHPHEAQKPQSLTVKI
ncbi:MAG: 50S ribosomal protein L13 [Tepidanaerobacter acetatoxydans]|jgi:large subunit ribosomal protein L13|uniref:Large ribosomal subunit protein uL13 n=1 Tax=Tepidanaerobacter acetatoxydans (strain DSM 21804 / JCM 16047 / Re1) TaxID=1209989 RepID=F4LSW9_TEPAE|nr:MULTISPECIES: 50S ribosomal protein L13 [Tepidanaerobacter]AEE90432.1 ribosomal protein L13 [Tepidanaerobacter acetatoxydans Re1]NLU09368.1 50S ribosomal protein L13 [Tepidanaerobacter acetatoxydans]CCP24925.1 ribosomal protein L13 [Tepidanaerobacter acetatoxydans Re1]